MAVPYWDAQPSEIPEQAKRDIPTILNLPVRLSYYQFLLLSNNQRGIFMNVYQFTNNSIALACREIDKFLSSAGVERREALRINLSCEEVLLNYQEQLGKDASFQIKLAKLMSSIRVEIIVAGESCNILQKEGEEDEVIRGLLASIGLAPAWCYKNKKNHILFTAKKQPLSGTTKMILAFILAIFAGMGLNLLPGTIRGSINDYMLTPVTDTFLGLISAVAGPLIFLSVLGSICSMGNMETLGKIGSRTIKTILLYMTVIACFMIAISFLFYPVQWGSAGSTSFSQILDLIYDIIPSNLFEPFITGNTLQLIFIAIMVGISMVMLSSSVNAIFQLVEQLSSIVQMMMTGLSSLLPVLVFFLLTGMISNGNIRTMLGSWQMVSVILLMLISYYILNIFRIAIFKKISPALLFQKALPTFFIAFTTASSSAAFSTNIQDSQLKLGIHKKLTEFGTPLGQVLFMPGFIALLYGLSAGFAQSYGIPITVPWVISAFITCLLVSFAIPPIPGGAMLGFTIVFAQLGIPMEVMGIALAINVITDFPCTACNVSSWQLTMIDVADSLHMLDQEVLHRGEAMKGDINKR